MGDKVETTVPGAIAYRAELAGDHPCNWQREYRTRAALENARQTITEISRICKDRPHTVHVIITVEGADHVDRLVPITAPDQFDRIEDAVNVGGTFTEVRHHIESDPSKWPKL